jgi:PDZ domain
MRRTLLILLILSVLSGLLALGLPATGEPPASSSDLSIDQLIQQLGNDDFKVREAAESELKKRPETMGALKQALKSADPEVRRRCEDLLRGIRSQRQSQLLKRIAQEGCADCLCCLTKADAQEAGMAFWECFRELFARVAEKADDPAGKHPAHSWRTQAPPNDGRWGFEWVQGRGMVPAQVTPHKLTWSDQWSSTHDIWHEGIFAETIRQQGEFGDVKFVCRGDVTVEGEFMSGAFLCTGNVKLTCKNKHRGSQSGILICDGDVEVPEIMNSVVIARGRVICNNIRESVIVQGRSKALGIHFFETSDAGVEVEEVPEFGVVIQRVIKDQAFARSGFQPGYRIVSVNGKNLESAEQLRRVLRQHYVDNVLDPQALPILVERGGKTMLLKLSYP